MLSSFGPLGPSGKLLENALAAKPKQSVVIALGNPYLILNFPEIENYVCTYSQTSTSEIAVVKALFGEIENNAKLPINSAWDRYAGLLHCMAVASIGPSPLFFASRKNPNDLKLQADLNLIFPQIGSRTKPYLECRLPLLGWSKTFCVRKLPATCACLRCHIVSLFRCRPSVLKQWPRK